MEYDFCGWATKANVKCTDGRTILKDAFKHNDGNIVPLVWNHRHNDPEAILGKAYLENRPDGVYAYGQFNGSPAGQAARESVMHGDIVSMSIYANHLKETMNHVSHGDIKEVSLVLSGANPKAYIESVMSHGEESDDTVKIFFDEPIELMHGEIGGEEMLEHAEKEKAIESEEKKEKTIGEIFEELTEEQQNAVYAVIGSIAEAYKTDEEETEMKQNCFDIDTEENAITHSDIKTIIDDAKRFGSLKESVIQHSEEYGIEQIDWLFPEAKTLNNPPEFIKRDTGWVSKVMNSVHHTPFSRIKSMFANITEDEARAKGYMKGNMKKDEVFSLLKRTTTPTTIYKKQKLDRDDVVDIVDFDVVSWLKSEMRMMLDEEIARAILIGDGRMASHDDHINDQCIRPIAYDDNLFTIKAKATVPANATDDQKAKAFIRAAIKARKDYKGSGEPTLYTTEDVLTNMLLIEDNIGHIMYDSVAKLANVLRVKEIVTVPVMEGIKAADGNDLLGIIVNLADYNVGADKGGSVNMFDDFDIDYNQMKYLIETRCSGAMIKPYAAIALELEESVG